MKESRATFVITTLLSFVIISLPGCNSVAEKSDSLPCGRIEAIESDKGILFTEGEQNVLFYQRRPRSLDGKYTRADYVHPLYGLDDQVLTEDFPADHPHHRGIFWAWHQVYIGDKRVGDSWSLTNIQWDVYEAQILAGNCESRALRVQVFWKSPLWTDATGQQKPFIDETTTITVHRAEGDIRKIDFEIKLLALEDGVRLGGAENERGYGGFSTRIRLPEGIEFTGQAGPVEPRGTSVEAGPWLDFSGPFVSDDQISGLAILCHMSNPGYPQRWILRRRGSMQNPVWPGREPVALSRKKPLILRYRLIIHRGDTHSTNLNHLQAEYNSLDY